MQCVFGATRAHTLNLIAVAVRHRTWGAAASKRHDMRADAPSLKSRETLTHTYAAAAPTRTEATLHSAVPADALLAR